MDSAKVLVDSGLNERAFELRKKAYDLSEPVFFDNPLLEVETNLQLSYGYADIFELDSALWYAKMALQICKRDEYIRQRFIAEVYYMICYTHFKAVDNDACVTCGNIAVEEIKNIQTASEFEMAIRIFMGYCNLRSGKPHIALQNAKEGLKLLNRNPALTNHHYTGVLYNCAGLICSKLGRYSEALEYYQKMLDLASTQRSSDKKIVLCMNVGGLHRNMGDFRRAIEWHERALELNRNKTEQLDRQTEANIYERIGRIYYINDRIQKAATYFEQAHSARKGTKYENSRYDIGPYRWLAMVYKKKGEYDKALINIHVARRMQEKISGKNHVSVSEIYRNLGEVHMLNGSLDSADYYLHRCLNIQLKEKGLDERKLTVTYMHIGNLYDYREQYEQSVLSHKLALEQFQKFDGNEPWRCAGHYWCIGSCIRENERCVQC